MSSELKLGAAALNQTPLDWRGNRQRIETAISAARAANVDVLCLPEMAISGYGCEDMFLSAAVQQRALDELLALLPAATGMLVAIGLPFVCEQRLYNAVALVADGAILGIVAKQHLPRDGIHYEPRWFDAWPAHDVQRVQVGGQQVPFGDVIVEYQGQRIGVEICEDAWVENRTGIALAARGVDVILNPSASHFAFGKWQRREALVIAGSQQLDCQYVYACLLGNEAGRVIYDGTCLIADRGELIAEGSRFSFAHCQLVHAGVPNPQQQLDKHEEFARAAALGLFDYLAKSKAGGFVISLSGGADSSACACLVWLACHLAWQELGRQGVAERLSNLDLTVVDSADALVRRLLLCAYQKTANSGAVTENAARDLARALNADWALLDVSELVDGYTQLVEGAVGRSLNWDQDDLALQNIQARVRGPSVWMLANLRNALLLATSNRSEAAVGYATMDGDTCGSISPLAGIDKAFLREWLVWLETQGLPGVGAVPALAAVNEQQPTAELRPAEQQQTDEGDLMPYPVLDFIERAAIRDKHSPAEVAGALATAFPDSIEQHGVWVRRFFQLWSRNQWKRERYAPSFHYDDANLDPKTWCRFPILSGGYEAELAELD